MKIKAIASSKRVILAIPLKIMNPFYCSVIFVGILSSSCITTYSEKTVQLSKGDYLVLPCETLQVAKIGRNSIQLYSKERNVELGNKDEMGINMGCSTRIRLQALNGKSAWIKVAQCRGGYMFP